MSRPHNSLVLGHNSNLNKKNYFDLITRHYPRSMKCFHKWIDSYKEKVNWVTTFNEGTQTIRKNDNGSISVSTDLQYTKKFHDLPFELQTGILIRFFTDMEKLVNFNVFNYIPVIELIDNFEMYLTRGFEKLEKGLELSDSAGNDQI